MVNGEGATMDDKKGLLGACLVLLGIVGLIPLFPAYFVPVPALVIILLVSIFGLSVTYSLRSVYSQANNGFIENNDPQAMALRRALVNRWRKLPGRPPILILPASKSQYMSLKEMVDVYVRRLVGKP